MASQHQADNRFPDSQKEPLGPNQIQWINEVYGKAFFRTPKPMVECNCKQTTGAA